MDDESSSLDSEENSEENYSSPEPESKIETELNSRKRKRGLEDDICERFTSVQL